MTQEPYLYEDFALRRALSSNLVGFCRHLRNQGLVSGIGEQMDALRALESIPLREQEPFRMALRTSLAKSTQEQEIFDEHFRKFWYVWESSGEFYRQPPGEEEERSKIHVIDERPKPTFLSIHDWMNQDSESEEVRDSAGYSPFEVDTERDFSQFGSEELNEVIALINEIGKRLATRFSRRMRHSKRHGPMDLRRTMRQSLRRGGELIDLMHHRRRRQRLKLVLLCDVSKSMDLYSRFLIQFIYAFQTVYRRIETFVFSTSLHRITDQLKQQSMDEAVARISESVPDWSGGTKIGASLKQFVEEYSLKVVDPATVVLVISDGWDTGEVEMLSESMSHLKRSARSLIWLNPLKGSPDYEPTTRGMQAALPHLDLFASAHNLNSLRDLMGELMLLQRG
ncbi:MAG TPA: VWA containing CoxE family protein [Deltaproteobacteria bacterium]|nr:VWA containing CoxE family protein [Deltaproteobacteria bacterium]